MSDKKRRILRFFTVIYNFFYFRSKKHKKYLQGWNDGMIDCLRKLSTNDYITPKIVDEIWKKNYLIDGDLFPKKRKSEVK